MLVQGSEQHLSNAMQIIKSVLNISTLKGKNVSFSLPIMCLIMLQDSRVCLVTLDAPWATYESSSQVF